MQWEILHYLSVLAEKYKSCISNDFDCYFVYDFAFSGTGFKRRNRVKWKYILSIFRARIRTGVIINLGHICLN